MTDLDLIATRDDTLDWVNEQRSKLNLPTLAEMPKGAICVHCECPVARALRGGNMIVSTLTTNSLLLPSGDEDDAIEINHPDYVRAFIRAFDKGAYPELVDDSYGAEAF